MADGVDRRQVTFEQAEGLVALPSQLAKEDVPSVLRAKVWSLVYRLIKNNSYYEIGYGEIVEENWQFELHNLVVERFGKPVDELDASPEAIAGYFKLSFMEGSYSQFYGVLQDFVRLGIVPDAVRRVFAEMLTDAKAAYRLEVDEFPPTLFPFGSDQEAASYLSALQECREAGLMGALSHLKQSSKSMVNGQFSESISNSIHAVESVCKAISNNERGTLKGALRALQSKGVQIHAALFRSLESLYGYASDEKGVRHALVFDDAANVDEIDALYMLGACASFITYIINKSRLVGLI